MKEKLFSKKHKVFDIFAFTLFIVLNTLTSFSLISRAEQELTDGEYRIEVGLIGGTGKATVTSPTTVIVKDGNVTIRLEWSSPNYDYMIVDDNQITPINKSGNSVFEIPIKAYTASVNVIADTTAMSIPHEIEYTIKLDWNSLREADAGVKRSGRILLDIAVFILTFTVTIALLTFFRRKRKKTKGIKNILLLLILVNGMMLCSCGAKKTDTTDAYSAPDMLNNTLCLNDSLELQYATGFSVDYYSDELAPDRQYKLITIKNEASYLVLPEGVDEAPEGISEDIIVIRAPKAAYLAASQAMDMLVAANALDRLRFSSLQAEDWYIEEAKERMEQGKLLYAGKYSAPDYELILEQGCDLAIENTMIYHSPEVKEKLEALGIPVLVDRSSYEAEPLGRTEWVKLYGALMDSEAEAGAAFDEQLEEYESINLKGVDDRPTVAFFYISTNGDVKVRKSGDYLPKMIEMAGGAYIFVDLGSGDDNASSTVNMQMEEFYATAKDADYIIYNSTIEGELESLQDLLDKNGLLANMKAVREEHVYCTAENLYQSSMETGTIISDINKMIMGETGMTFLFQLK
ncbi:MAG: ABC transporter substrate-binding protein [Wujia sp.]